jgi:RND family efflux transporter MFP subunit
LVFGGLSFGLGGNGHLVLLFPGGNKKWTGGEGGGHYRDALTLSGQIDAAEKSTMTFQTTGKLAFIKVKEGDEVKKGQLLAGLDTGDLAAAEKSAYYKYLAADVHAKYIEDTVKDHAKDETYLQRDSRVAAQTDRDIKYDTWLTAQRALRYANLHSPIAGVVYDIPPTQPGEFITSTNTIAFDIVNPETIYFSATADQTEVGQLKNGQAAKVTLDANMEAPFEGEIENIAFAPKEDETGTVYEVRLTLSGEGSFAPRLAMTGDVNFVLGKHVNVIAVSSRYLKTNNGKKTVLKLVNGRKQQVEVETGGTIDGKTIISGGLTEGETIYDQTR